MKEEATEYVKDNDTTAGSERRSRPDRIPVYGVGGGGGKSSWGKSMAGGAGSGSGEKPGGSHMNSFDRRNQQERTQDNSP